MGGSDRGAQITLTLNQIKELLQQQHTPLMANVSTKHTANLIKLAQSTLQQYGVTVTPHYTFSD